MPAQTRPCPSVTPTTLQTTHVPSTLPAVLDDHSLKGGLCLLLTVVYVLPGEIQPGVGIRHNLRSNLHQNTLHVHAAKTHSSRVSLSPFIVSVCHFFFYIPRCRWTGTILTASASACRCFPRWSHDLGSSTHDTVDPHRPQATQWVLGNGHQSIGTRLQCSVHRTNGHGVDLYYKMNVCQMGWHNLYSPVRNLNLGLRILTKGGFMG